MNEIIMKDSRRFLIKDFKKVVSSVGGEKVEVVHK